MTMLRESVESKVALQTVRHELLLVTLSTAGDVFTVCIVVSF